MSDRDDLLARLDNAASNKNHPMLPTSMIADKQLAEDAAALIRAQEDEIARVRAELSYVDATLARRPALDKGNRIDNILHAINTAARSDANEKENTRLRTQIEAAALRVTGQEELLTGALRAHIVELDAEVLALRQALGCVLQVSRGALLWPVEPVQEVPEFLKRQGGE
jgi:hypothetical protein